MKLKIVGANYKDDGKIYYFDNNNFDLVVNDNIIVETEKGMQFATVKKETFSIEADNSDNYKKVIRVANKEDEEINNNNIVDAKIALESAIKISKKLDLKMKFIDAEYTFDRNQLILFFLSDNRVDFRELARQLASLYRTRIELRQLGVRDKAKSMSGIGQCGRKICCSLFLKDLDSVSINMAKNQNIAINPTKINGLCGRLLCCLNYEDDLYYNNKQSLPELGQNIDTPHGKGKVISLDVPNLKYVVFVENYGKVEEIVKYEEKCKQCQNNCK